MNTLRTFLTGAALVSVLAVGNVALSGGDGRPASSAEAAERMAQPAGEVQESDPDLKAIEDFFSRDEGDSTPTASTGRGQRRAADNAPEGIPAPQTKPVAASGADATAPAATPAPSPTPRTAAQPAAATPASARTQVAASEGDVVYDLSPEEVRTLQNFLGDRVSQDESGRILLDGKPADLGQLMAAVQREHERQLSDHVAQLTARHKRLAEISRTLDRLKRETTELFAENQREESQFQMLMARRQQALEVLSGVVTKDLKKLDALLSSVN